MDKTHPQSLHRSSGDAVIKTEDTIAPARFGFVMELQAGMQTQYRNWRSVVEKEPQIEATWVPITYYDPNGWIERLVFLPHTARAAARCYQQVAQGLGQTRYDAVLFNTHNTAVINRKAALRQRSFLMFDVTPCQYDQMAQWYKHTPDRSFLIHNLKHRRVSLTLKSAEGLFAWSQWAAQSACEDYGADPNQVYIVPPGVDTSLWTPLPEERKPANGITRLLFIGFDFERKGGDLLMRWACETPLRNWEMHIVTMNPQKAPPGVHIHTGLGSNAPEMIRLAQQCDIFVLPTRADCFSLVSLEAMATGLPVITTRVGGIPDIVREGETGYLLEPNDYEGLRDRLEHLIASPELRRKLGQCGRQRVCAHFDSVQCVRKGLRIMAGETVV